ncbi:nitrogen regulation protein NR(II) [Algiphilus sp.]|uniref:nitrogen regulation protein NR(II) n=1 Tax=Algiphilus sp. TaxID=1872431 RepID=UPI001CA7279F|nr:nitrogen regulation protein NR(II) [Algiphilus sp.]MBY8964669.1 PAS domain-containing protein [Algiphilus acroporae]MCI5061733.1 ATP-binding protein [Algiphilus sp.]MCI5102453.1 ATP-binding protein [Algiphilus sp.]
MKFTARARLKSDLVLESITTGIIAVDARLCVGYINPAAETLFGVSEGHALGEPLHIAIPHFSQHMERLRHSIATTAGFIERELEMRRGQDRPITVDLIVTPALFGKQPGLVMEATALDRHLRISRDEWLQAQFDAGRQLVRGLAHEIKNPLGGIRGAAQLLEHEFPDSVHREYTQVITREADRLQNLVDRMLGPNRMPVRDTLNVHAMLEHVRHLVEAEAGDWLTVERDYDPSIPDIEGDREQLVQSALNIARNAMQALEGQTDATLTLRTRVRRQHTIAGTLHRMVVQIDIEDNGPGIPQTLLEKIFYPMVTTRATGSGLGLPISQYLVHGHNGVIECHSRTGCTTFSIYLPLPSS